VPTDTAPTFKAARMSATENRLVRLVEVDSE
jgi:hypothetical protein